MKLQYFILVVIFSDIQGLDIKADYFIRLSNQKINKSDPTILIESFQTQHKRLCLKGCFKYDGCEYADFKNKTCVLYSYNARFYISFDSQNKLYRKRIPKNLRLVSYWPVTDGSLKDVSNAQDLYEQTNFSFISDRFGNTNSAFRIQSGYARAPAGIYFSGDFTITAWVRLNAYLNHQRLIEFGKQLYSDHVLVSLSGPSRQIYFHTYNGNIQYVLDSTTVLPLSIWHYVTFTASGPVMKIYVNGTLVANKTQSATNVVQSVNRLYNFFGKSLFPDPNANCDLDDLKIYNKELSGSEIEKEFKSDFF
ncbi:unnamed protein product [Brachionus calyciflorus]|uniref:Uncharacterized protein n=1 Tax=Brachionus calyciflorus TaxID=104777 RepID=A0A814BDG2_9BILA|nr:unnamed protein product [Brachionus calyciflorus]